MQDSLIRAVRIAAFALAAYVGITLSGNGLAGIFQPELGAGSGEGVLRTFTSDGEVYERRLAVVEDGDVLWLASVQYFRRWYDRAVANPEVELVRNGQVELYRAVPVRTPGARAHLTQLLEVRAGAVRFAFMRAFWLFAEIKPLRLDPR